MGLLDFHTYYKHII